MAAIFAAEHSNSSSSVLSIGSLPPSPASPETAASEAVESAVAQLAPFESSSGSHSVSPAYRTRRGLGWPVAPLFGSCGALGFVGSIKRE